MLHDTARALAPALLALFIAAAACSGDEATDDPAEDGVADGDDDDAGTDGEAMDEGDGPAALTYWAAAKPVLDAKCNGCHFDGGVAPFPFETYQDALAYAPAIAAAVESGSMPPWHASEGCRDYNYDRSLTDEQRDLLLAWVDAGTPEGDPQDATPSPAPDIPELARVDMTLQMDAEYTPKKSPDDHRCFVMDWPDSLQGTQYVTGTHVRPGNLGIVHHVLAFQVFPEAVDQVLALDADDPGPGYECFAGVGAPQVSMLGGWAPGGGAGVLGSNTDDQIGIRIEPGSKVVMQVHYNTLEVSGETDVSGLDVMVSDSVDREAFVTLATDPQFLFGMNIPAGEDAVIHQSEIPRFFLGTNEPVELLGVGFHMHLLGRRGGVSLLRDDGTEECLLEIDDWDFGWQGTYSLAQPTVWGKNDRMKFWCEFDNSKGNQPYVDGERIDPQDTQWGEGTTDEMCLVPLVYAAVP